MKSTPYRRPQRSASGLLISESSASGSAMPWSIEAAFRKVELSAALNDIRSWLESNDCDLNAFEIIVQTCTVVLLRIEFANENLAKEFGYAFQGSMVAPPTYFAV